ncbi:VWA domain-containing protein [Nocardia takedensis]
MGTHRSGTRSRGVSKGPVIAVVVLVLLVAATFAWFQFRDRAADRDSAAASECVEGESVLDVTADPDIAVPVRTLAERYNATKPTVRDHCATVRVRAADSAAVAAGLAPGGSWNEALGPKPALWIADSSRSIEAVRVPGLMEGEPTPIASSPVVLGVAEPLRQALEAARIAWSDLPNLQQGSLADLGLSGWGGLRMALPPGDSSLAAATAIGAMVSGVDPLTTEAARSGQVSSAVSGLSAAAPESTGTGAALDTIATAQSPDEATIHAVPATIQQLDAHMGVVGYQPVGAAPIADHPAAVMSGSWVDQTQNLVAGVFTAFLTTPQNAAVFQEAGFTAAAPDIVPGATREALAGLTKNIADPVLGVHATVLLDVSASMSGTDGAGTRLSNSLGALRSTLQVMPPDFGLGIWTFGKNLDGAKPYKVLVPTERLDTGQRSTVDTALSAVKVTESKTDQAYPTLLAAYRQAVADYAAERANSLLLITDGPDDDSSVTGAQLLADITAATDASRPVRIDVVAIGGAGTQTLRDLAQRTGGTYTAADASGNLAFASAVVQALTTP